MPSAGSYTSKIGYLSVAKNVKVQLPGGVSNTFRPGLPDMCSDFKTTTPATTKTTGGIITTLAGNGYQSRSSGNGLAVNNGLYNPISLVADINGNVFYVDRSVETIMEETGEVTEIVTTSIFKIDTRGLLTPTDATFNDLVHGTNYRINCVIFDASVNAIYFCNSHSIYKLLLEDHTYTVIYTDTAGRGLSHIALDITPGAILVSTTTDQIIYRITLETGAISQVINTYANFVDIVASEEYTTINSSTRPITVDSNGNIYVSRLLREFYGGGYVFTFQIQKYNISGNTLWTVSFDVGRRVSTFNYMGITGIAIGPDGNVYTSSPILGGNIVLRIDQDEQYIELLNNIYTGVIEPSISLRGEGITTIAGGGPSPPFFGDGGPAIQSNLNFPGAIAFDPNHNLIICDRNNYRIRKVTPFVTTTTLGKTTYSPPWFAPVEYTESCKCRVTTRRYDFPTRIVYDGL